MTLDRKHIDDLFQNQLHDFEQSPPPGVWDCIDEEMGRIGKRRKRMILRNVAVAASLVASFGLGYFVSEKVARQTPLSTTAQEIAQGEKIPVEKNQMDNAVSIKALGPENSNLVADNTPMAPASESDPGNAPQKIYHSDLNETEQNPYHEMITGDLATMEENIVTEPEKERPGRIGYTMEQLKSIRLILLPSDNTFFLASISRNNTHEDLLFPDDLVDLQTGKENKWGVGGQVAPLYSYRSIETENLALQNSYNQYQSGILAYAGGVNISYQADRKWSLHSGVYYSKIGHSNNSSTLVTKSANADNTITGTDLYNYPAGSYESQSELIVSSSTGNIEPSTDNVKVTTDEVISYASFIEAGANITDAGEVDVLQYFEYIEVPILAKYKIIDRKVDFNLLGGVSSHLLVGNPIYVIQDGKKEWFGVTSGISKFNYSSVVGIGVAYPVTHSISLSVEPTFRYYINSFYTDTKNDASFHPYSFGVFTGLSYRF